jgi:hypothetical protein
MKRANLDRWPGLAPSGDAMSSKTNISLRAVAWLSLVALIAAAGCGSDDELKSPTAKRLRGIATYYLDLTFARNGAGPVSEQELKKHMRRQERSDLASNGIDPQSIDSTLFVSERDGEPFVVLYGQSIRQVTATTAPLVAHEKTGKDGKRLAVLANNKVFLVDAAGLEALK